MRSQLPCLEMYSATACGLVGGMKQTRTLKILCCGSARFRRLFPDYCEEHAQRLASQVQARAVGE